MMCKKKTILITLILCLVGTMTSFADVIVYENDFEDPCQVDALSGWNWADGGQVHNVVYADYEGNMVAEHTGTIDNSAGTASVTTRFGSKWGITLSGNTSTDPNDYTIEFDLQSVSGNWDPIDLEFFVLTGGGNGVGYGSGASSYAQADGWVHVKANLANLPAGWWAGQAWDMTDPNWQIEVGGPPWPGVEVPAGTPAWDQIWLMDNLKITMVSGPVPVHAYNFEDGTADDSVGDANGTLIGGAVIKNGAMVTSAQDQWMEMPGDVIAMNTYSGVTVEAWYTPEAGANTSWTMLAYFGDSTDPNVSAGVGNDGFFITSARGDDVSRAAISIGNPDAPYASESGANGPEYDDGLLHHMVSTIDDVNITLYIDGELQASTPLDPNNVIAGISTNYALLAKGGYGSDPEWIGAIDEFNIYNKALSAEEIAVLYAAGPLKVGPQPVDPGTDGLVAYYPLDAAYRGSTPDASGNGNDGAIMGDPAFVEGVVAQAIDLDGDGDYIDCGAAEIFGMQETNAMTAAAWVTIRSIPAAWSAVVAKGEYAWRISNANMDPRFHFGITIWNAPDTFGTDGVIAVGYDEWHHVAGTFDGATISLYVDGVLDINVPTTEPIGANEASVLIGENPESAGRYWDGLIDEVILYNRALSMNEVLFLAQ
jgi:hypothetical protein